MQTLETIWLYIKKYWQIFLLVISFLIGLFLFRKKSISFVDTINELDKLHKDEIDRIKKIRDEEIEKNEIARKKTEEEKKKISDEYDKIKQEIELNKKSDIKKIVERTEDNPDELAKELQEVTKFKIIK